MHLQSEQFYTKETKVFGCWLEQFSYAERLREVEKFSSEKRRPQEDLIVTFQYL